MAITSKKDGQTVEVTSDSSTAWTWQDASHGWGTKSPFVRLYSIHWIPAATGDVCCIRNATTSGPIIFYAKAADAYDQRIVYYDGRNLKPVLDQSTNSGAGQLVVFMVK